MSTITTEYKGDMLLQTSVGHHTVLMDVPDTMGGKDRGMTPPQIFIASLSSCVAAFAAQYCNQHDLDATGLKVDVNFEKAANPARLVNLSAEVFLPNVEIGNRERALRSVAKHCPVHMTIENFEGMDLVIKDATAMEVPVLV